VVERVEQSREARPSLLPGAVLAAETPADGQQIAAVGDSWAADTICSIGSMTKAFTAIAVLLALEEHERLDPELAVWRLPGMEAYADDPMKQRVRVRHLLQHTSGLPGFRPCPLSEDSSGKPPPPAEPVPNVGPTISWIGSPAYTNEYVCVRGESWPARLLNLDAVSDYVMRTYPLEHEPGSRFSYSSANYIVAGRIVECLTGRSLNLYLKERLFKPLGMSDSFFIAQATGDPTVDARIEEGVSDSQRERIAHVSLITRDGQWPPEVAPGPDGGWDRFRKGWRYVYPDGGMYTTARDLLTFLGMVRDGGCVGTRRILSPTIVELLVNDQGFDHTMGFGYRRRPTPYGQGAGTVDHLGNIMTYFWYDPRTGNPLLGVFLSQRLANAAVNNNMADGLGVMFRVFVPLVTSGALGLEPPSLANSA
jgi:CubicO group peptidase (beta-lactamase class C family)